jgi:hypothetical protein
MRADAPILNFCIWVATGLLVYSFILYAIRWVRLMRTGGLPEDLMSSAEGDQSVGSMRHKAGHVS